MIRGLSCRRDEVRGIKIILAGNPDQGEEGIAARISQRRVRCGVAVSAMAQTGQSEAIHSPEAWARTVVKFTVPAVWSMAVVWIVAISCWRKVLRTMPSPLDNGA
jgi:hypothetical protein